jgi:hypothetical protein
MFQRLDLHVAGLDPATHVFVGSSTNVAKGVDGRVEPGQGDQTAVFSAEH